MKKTHKKVSSKVTRNATIANFGRIGVDLDPNSPRWANRQVSALNSAMTVIENLDLTSKELEFLQDTFLPQLISERSPDFKRLVLAPAPAPVKAREPKKARHVAIVKKAA